MIKTLFKNGPKTLVLHLTDMHFGENINKSLSVPDFSYLNIAELIAKTIIEEHSNSFTELIIALGGDITNQGNQKKYQYAHKFINKLKNGLDGISIKYILCPGNHDIQTEKSNSFEEFNIFSSELTKNQEFLFTDLRTTASVNINNWTFISTNSIYHKDHKYGLIETNHLENKISKAKYPVILMTHHHLIPMYKDDVSTIRNAYDVIRICIKYGVRLIIHGHVHSSLKMQFGSSKNGLYVVGCGATLPNLGSNYNNQFNVFELKQDKYQIEQYRIIYDGAKTNKPSIIKS